MKVSFEGGRKRNDSIRGRGVYDRALRGMNYLKERGINTSVRLTLHRGSINGLDELFADLADVDVTSVKVATVKPIGRAALPENDDLFGFSATMESLYQILDLGSRYGIDMHFSSDDFPFRPEEINDDKPRFQDHRNCGAGFETVYVSPSGDVMPCSSMQDVILGNIAEADFATVWNGEQTREYRRSAERCDIQRLCCCENIRTVHGQDSS